jgi:hypothetical protein
MSKGSTMSRRQRRGQFRAAGYLKIKNMFGRFSEQGRAWYDKMAADGKAAHEAHVNRVNDERENQLQTILNGLIKTWGSMGYNKEEISKLEEAFALDSIKDKNTYREDKKEARRLRKEAQSSLKARLNANN